MRKTFIVFAGLFMAFFLPWVLPPMLSGQEVPTLADILLVGWHKHCQDVFRILPFQILAICLTAMSATIILWVRVPTKKSFFALQGMALLVSPLGFVVMSAIGLMLK